MQSLTAVVLGATGLIGEQLVQQLLDDPAYSKVRILVRRPLEISHTKLEIAVVNFDNPVECRIKLGKGDCLFCCIGTTNKKVKGNNAAYRKVDFDIPVNAALWAKEAGFASYLLVSAVGANKASSNFYLRLKGEVENEIAGLHFQSFHIFRPGLLLGERKEFRFGELIAKPISKVLSLFLIGGLAKYKGVQADAVAKAMTAVAKSGKQGKWVYYYPDIIEAAKG